MRPERGKYGLASSHQLSSFMLPLFSNRAVKMFVSQLQVADSCGLPSPRSPFRPRSITSFALMLRAASAATCTNAASRTPFDLMQRSSTTAVVRKHLWGNVAPAPEQTTGWADWLFEEADALNQQQTHPASPSNSAAAFRSHLHGTSHLNDFTARDAVALMPLLSLHSDAVFAEVGLRCRGRLPLNLALNCPAKEYISVCPDLQLTVDSSQLCSPILQAGMTKCPVTFICAEPHNFHFNGVSHVLLHNRPGDGLDQNTCRTIAAKLAASPKFQVLLCTAPLPFQHHLVYIGDANLHPSSQPGSGQSQGSSRSRLLDSDLLESPTLHIYGTSFEAAPIGTIASLYCQTGICCLPGNALHAVSRHVASDAQTEGRRRAPLELPPLAVHTAAFQDLCSGKHASS